MSKLAEQPQPFDELPPSAFPWRIHAFDRSVVLVNPEHAPRVIRDGIVQVLSGANPDPCVDAKTVAVSHPRIFQFFVRGSS